MLPSLFSSAKAALSAAIYAALLLSACSATPAEEEVAKNVVRKSAVARRVIPPAVPAALPTRTLRITNDTLAGDPFGQELTVEQLVAAGARVTTRKPFQNRHVSGQTDTIVVLRHQGNVFEFYRTPEKDLLQDASVTNFQPAYGQRLKRRLQKAHRAGRQSIDKVRIGDTERANYVSVTFQQGRLSAVHVEPYVD
ncbi:hypothetical protein HER32_10945 [Hymenobacter sp. BT18]|uniref:hypothetical protein n=1 Tax=Hymenobacter sp. BT18 TaxID=2835648 RepID=UPI00143E12E4|nr:hypothetical protein [Hymenobacter sp. BT18]QIX61667.1 hypothetical protein HER32_10945 [Hymenobacter sp. BT18]